METREEQLAAQAKHLEEVQKEFPNNDMSSLLENMQKSVHFKYDVKETLGDEAWDKMEGIMEAVYDAKSIEEIEDIKLKAKKCLEGHRNLQERFDVIFQELDLQAVALADDLTPESGMTNR